MTEKQILIKKCKKCKSKDIFFWDCGYSSFNPGGGRCKKCGFKVKDEAGCLPDKNLLIKIWNRGQKPDQESKLKTARKIAKTLRVQLRNHGIKPLV